jgi:HD-like signal output (HDOD) protein
MLTTHQRRWGIEQWVEFLKDKEIPVLTRTRALIQALREPGAVAQEAPAARELLGIVYSDPYLSLKLLRRAERQRSRRLGQETTTALAAIMHAGFDEIIALVDGSPCADDALRGANDCEFRVVMAASIARGWARLRTDVSPEEVALAALLSETGELLLWHFAPELTLKAEEELTSGRAFRTLKAQQQAVGFSFRQMTLALVQRWELPAIIALLIKGTDTPRANIARLAIDTAGHIVADACHPSIPADLINIRNIIPAASYASLAAALPIAEDYRFRVLAAVMADTDSTSSKDRR